MNVIDKVKKLLALADSPNENEAKEALLKARALMAEHKLREEDVTEPEEVKVIRKNIGIKVSKRKNAWAIPLSATIAGRYCCKAFRTRTKGKQLVEIGLVGLEGDFELCERVFRYAFDCVASQCEEIRRQHRHMYTLSYLAEITDAYGHGFIDGLKEAFRQQEAEHQEYGLVLVVPQEVHDAMKDMGKPKDFKPLELDDHKMRFALDGYRDGKEFDPSTKLEASAC